MYIYKGKDHDNLRLKLAIEAEVRYTAQLLSITEEEMGERVDALINSQRSENDS